MKKSEVLNHFQSAVDLIFINDLDGLARVLHDHQNLVGFTVDGEGLVHIATDNNRLQVLQLLLRLGSDPDLQNALGETCLHIAVFRGYFDIADLLLKNASNARIVNSDGKSPLDYAEEFNETRIKELILFFDQLGLESLEFSYSCSISDELLPQPAYLLTKSSFDAHQDSTNNSIIVIPKNQEMIETSRICFNEELFDFLHSMKLSQFFAVFVRNGLDHLSLLAMQMNTPLPFDHLTLKNLGVKRPDDRSKIMDGLRKIRGFQRNFSFQDLKTLLGFLKLEEFFIGFHNAGLNLENCVHLMAHERQFEENTLIKKIGMKKIGHRLRILGILKMVSKNQKFCNLL